MVARESDSRPTNYCIGSQWKE